MDKCSHPSHSVLLAIVANYVSPARQTKGQEGNAQTVEGRGTAQERHGTGLEEDSKDHQRVGRPVQ